MEAAEKDEDGLGARLRRRREELGLSQAQVARRAEPPTSQQQIDKLESDTREVTLRWLRRLQPALNFDIAGLLDGSHIPVRGYVRAGSDEIEYLEAVAAGAGIDEIDVYAEDAEALRVRGNSMAPRYFDGEVVIYRESVEPSEYLHRDCVVFLRDGRTMLKRVEPGTKKGHFTLRSYNPAEPTVVDAAVRKIAPVIWVRR